MHHAMSFIEMTNGTLFETAAAHFVVRLLKKSEEGSVNVSGR